MVMVLPIAGCSFGLSSLDDKTIGVYSLMGDLESGKNVEEYKLNDFEFKTIHGADLVPYVSIETYSNLIKPHIIDGYKIEYYDEYENTSFYVRDEDGNYLFLMEIYPKDKEIYSAGSLSSLLKEAKDYSKSSLYAQMSTTADTVRGMERNGASYYGNTSYRVSRRNGVTYYPLSLLDSALSSDTGICHLYNYNRIIQYDDYEKLTSFKYLDNDKEMTPFNEMKSYIDLNLPTMPNYIIQDRANAFFFIMDNRYGLAYTRKIGSMVKYYMSQSYYDYFFSANVAERNEALYAAIGLLDDGHSAMNEDETAPWFTQAYRYGGSRIQNLVRVRTELSSSRGTFYQNLNKKPGDVLYSNSGKLAFYSFDSFTFDENAYNGDELKPDLYKTDSYFNFVKTLNEIKNHGGVDTVVIDVSLNGGGVVGILMKTLALISKDNKAPIYFMDDKSLLVEKDVTSVDANGDEEYDENDCFGNTFKFAILTSGYSFSCGNALPYYASKNGYATIVGQNSGGGECAVEESYLPTGEHFFHSSNLHIGYFDEKTRIWEGDENGAPVDHLIDYSDFYNLENLDQLLN